MISSIGKGILVFAAVAPGDTEKDINTLASKVLKMRLWDDEAGGRVRSHSVWVLRLKKNPNFLHSGSRTFKISVGKSFVVRDDSQGSAYLG
jgi:D-tyrosyl-tRNA(Tyr) deacylase